VGAGGCRRRIPLPLVRPWAGGFAPGSGPALEVLLGSGNCDFVPAFARGELSVRAKRWCVAEAPVSVCLSVGRSVRARRQQGGEFVSGKILVFSPSLTFTKSRLVSLLSLRRRKEIQACGVSVYCFPSVVFSSKALQSTRKAGWGLTGPGVLPSQRHPAPTGSAAPAGLSKSPYTNQLFCYEKASNNNLIKLFFSTLPSKPVT